MNEREWWSRKVQPKLHTPPRHLALKIQDAFVMGRPDVLFTVPDTTALSRPTQLTGFIELKYRECWPTRQSTLVDIGLSQEQRRHLEQWYQATRDRRTANVLFGVGHEWYLLHFASPIVRPQTRWTPTAIVGEAVISGHLSELPHFWERLVSLSQEDFF